MRSSRVIIVGSGIIGMLCALKLQERGVAVTVIEERTFGGQATMASTGMLAPWTELRDTAAFAFAQDSLECYKPLCEQLLEQTGRDPGYCDSGIFELAESPQEAEHLMALAGPGDSEWLDAPGLRTMVPGLSEAMCGALYRRREARVHVPSLMSAARKAAAINGITLRGGERVVEVLQTHGRVVGVRSTAGSLDADTVVLAAGAWSSILADVTGVRVPVIPVRGQVLILDDTHARLRQVLFSHQSGYLTPQADGTLVVGATEDECGYQMGVSAGGVAKIAQVLLRLTPELADLPFLMGRSGLRPKTPDGQPLLGPVTGLEGLILATGHFRSGIVMAPATAEAVADLVVDGQTALPIDAFTPERFL